MKYDLEAMEFDVGEARAALEDRAHLPFAFIWCEEPEEAASFWRDAGCGRVPADDWHPKVKAMIAQWEAENGEGDKPTVTVNMSLRDWFAGQALAGLGDRMIWPEGVTSVDQSDPRIDIRKTEAQQARARYAYRQADAMMAERKKGGE